jgi:hypothetical protein
MSGVFVSCRLTLKGKDYTPVYLANFLNLQVLTNFYINSPCCISNIAVTSLYFPLWTFLKYDSAKTLVMIIISTSEFCTP